MYEQNAFLEAGPKVIPATFGHGLRFVPSVPGGAESWLSRVPVMPVTILALDLVLQEPSIDLETLSRLVLSDVGATLHLFHLLGQEDIGCIGLSRMNECLASLDVKEWFLTLSTHAAVFHAEHHAAIAALWKHSHYIAQCAERLAGTLDGISAESACLIGLLHEVKAIAEVLGAYSPLSSGAVLESIGGVPAFVCSALNGGNSSMAAFWTAVLKVAHELAEGPRAVLSIPLDLDESARLRARILSELSLAQAC